MCMNVWKEPFSLYPIFLTLVNTVDLWVDTTVFMRQGLPEAGSTLGSGALTISDVPQLAVPLGGTLSQRASLSLGGKMHPSNLLAPSAGPHT